MKLISYAQNFEDVVLWRALKGVNEGFYIDVGAADPEEISVTKAFYDRGWSGINIEPTRGYFQRLVEARPRDLNLNVAAGAAAGLIVLNQISGTGLSTSDEEVARRHAEAGWQSRETRVPTLTLTSICESHGVGEIHFLKVDVEGAEADVLRGMDFSRFRPWIVVVEATEPLSSARVDGAYEALLLGQGYSGAYFDGLNMFYVANEHADLKDALGAPANVFDDYVTAAQQRLEAMAAEQAVTIDSLSHRVKDMDDDLNALREEAATARQAREQADALAAGLGQELADAKAAVQRLTLHADQIRRRLATSNAQAEQYHESSRSLRVERDALLLERDALLAQRETLLAEQDAVSLIRAERDRLLAERDALRIAQETTRAERDNEARHVRALSATAAHLTHEQNKLHAEHAKVTSLLDAVRVSTSWRVTRPVRVLGRAVKAGLQRPGS